MTTRAFGFTGVEVPVIGQGTWKMGDRARRREEVAAVRFGIELGLTHLDTAELYGEAEDVVREAIAGFPRERLFIVSKVLPSNGSYAGTVRACEQSLRRIGTEYLDAYLLHWPDANPLVETMRAMVELVRTGKIRFAGVSNCDVAQLEEAQAALGDVRLACNQVLYHLQQRAVEKHVLPWCENHNVALVGYSPFGSGDFPEPESSGGRALASLAAARSATPRQIALAYLVRQAALFTIPKASDPEHVRENAGALDLVLADSEIAALDRVFPAPKRVGSLPTL